MGPILAANSLYRDLYSFFTGLLPVSLAWLAYFIAGFAIVFLLVNALILITMGVIYLERRLIGRFQARMGPNRVGPFGLLQPVADALKILFKEDIVPTGADRWVFNAAPVVLLVPVILVLAVVPFGKNSFLADVNIGILYVIGVTTISTLGIFMAGWSSGNRYAMLGAMRAVAQLLSYEVPMVLAVVGILLLAGSLSLVRIVEAQRLPFLLLQPLGFFIFVTAASAELHRSPFDLAEAESELVAGYHTEYSGMKFGLIQLSEFAAAVVTSTIVVTLFFRGWENPFVPLGWPQVLPSHLWFLLKVFFVLFLFMWVRATLPRLRVDQIMGFAWKVLFPLALVNLFLTAVEVLVWPEPTTGQLWAMVAINVGVAVAGIIGFSLAMERQRRLPTSSVVLVKLPTEVG